MWNEALLLIESLVAQSISILDSSQTRNPSRENRKVAWTVTGGKGNGKGNRSAHRCADTNTGSSLSFDNDDARQKDKQHHVTSIQFRLAWFEQLILHMTGIPHTVINSKYAAGPLPCLRHGNALVGRHYPHHNPPGNNNTNHTMVTYCYR